MRQVTPPVQFVQTLERALTGDLGVSVEGTNASVPGDDPYHSLSSNQLTMLKAEPYGAKRYIDLFHIGINDISWNITTDKPYITFSKSTGQLSPESDDVRIYVNIDWTAAPNNSTNALINITSSTDYGAQFAMPQLLLPISHTRVPSSFKGFIESDATISIEAEHYSRVSGASSNISLSTNSSSDLYTVLPGYGRTLSAITLSNANSPSLTAPGAPALEYDIYTFTSANSSKPANITLILGQGLNANPSRPLRYAVAVDNQTPQTVKYIQDQTGGNLPVGWGDAVANAAWKSTVNATMASGKHTLRVWLLEPAVVLQKVVVDLGGVRASYLWPPESTRV